jgi:hypothetical protein
MLTLGRPIALPLLARNFLFIFPPMRAHGAKDHSSSPMIDELLIVGLNGHSIAR